MKRAGMTCRIAPRVWKEPGVAAKQARYHRELIGGCELASTHGIGFPGMQRVPKPGLFTRESTIRSAAELFFMSLLENKEENKERNYKKV